MRQNKFIICLSLTIFFFLTLFLFFVQSAEATGEYKNGCYMGIRRQNTDNINPNPMDYLLRYDNCTSLSSRPNPAPGNSPFIYQGGCDINTRSCWTDADAQVVDGQFQAYSDTCSYLIATYVCDGKKNTCLGYDDCATNETCNPYLRGPEDEGSTNSHAPPDIVSYEILPSTDIYYSNACPSGGGSTGYRITKELTESYINSVGCGKTIEVAVINRSGFGDCIRPDHPTDHGAGSERCKGAFASDPETGEMNYTALNNFSNFIDSFVYYTGDCENSVCSSIAPPSETGDLAGKVYRTFSYVATVDMQNTGFNSWTQSAYDLRLQDSSSWTPNGVSLDGGDTISYGQTKNFIMLVTAPYNTGSYSFNWQMAKSGVPFGQKCTSSVQVIAHPSGSITASPNPVDVGNTVTFTVNNALANSGTLTKGYILVSKTDNEDPYNWGCPDGKRVTDTNNKYWCTVKDLDNPPSTFNDVLTITQAGTYYAAVNLINSDGGKCSGNPYGRPAGWAGCGTSDKVTVTVNTNINPPIINSLQVGQKPGTQSTISGGKWKMSGRQTSEEGSDWLNPITIKLNATAGTGGTTEYYTAFYTGSQLTNKTTFLSDVQAKVSNPANGFLLGEYSGKQWVWNPRKNSCSGGWENLTDELSGRIEIYSCDGTTHYYRAEPVAPATIPQWSIYFFKDVPSQTFNTAGYATTNMDVSVSDLKGEMQPSPIP